jgi:hypothetical protein
MLTGGHGAWNNRRPSGMNRVWKHILRHRPLVLLYTVNEPRRSSGLPRGVRVAAGDMARSVLRPREHRPLPLQHRRPLPEVRAAPAVTVQCYQVIPRNRQAGHLAGVAALASFSTPGFFPVALLQAREFLHQFPVNEHESAAGREPK